MPSTVRSLFGAAGLAPAGFTRWPELAHERRTGVYAVTLDEDADGVAGAVSECPVSGLRLRELLAVRPELRLDGKRPSPDTLARRLAGFWLPDEVVLYVGLSSRPVRTRLREYRDTPLGAAKPHAGGWWLKTLTIIPELVVFYAPTPEFQRAERAMLKAFAEGVSTASRATLHDRERVMPFANLRGHDNRVKRHGITGATRGAPAAG